MNKIYKFYSILAFLILSIGSANAWTFTWNGSDNDNWNNGTNWTRSGAGGGNPTVPGSADDVVINNGGASNQPDLPSDYTISNLTMSAGVLDMRGYTLTVTNNASFTGGTVQSGWIDADNFTNMSNTTFDAAGNVLVLNKTNGGGTNDVSGGNTFIGPLAVVNSSSNRLRLANTNPDIYVGLMHYEERSTGALEPAYNGINLFPADISTDGSTNLVSFAMGTGTVVLNGYTTLHGSQSFINRLTVNTTQIYSMHGDQTVNLFRLIAGDVDINSNILTVSGNARITGGIVQDGIFEFNNLDTMQNAAFSSVQIIKDGGGNNTLRGGNTFTNDVLIRNNDDNFLRMANVVGDDYNGSVIFMEMSSGALEPAYNGTNTFAGEISTTGSSNVVSFGANNGTIVIDGSGDQTISGDVGNTPTFTRIKMNKSSGNLYLGGINLMISVQLDFTTGIIASTSSNFPVFGDNAIAINASNNSYVAGPVRKVGNDDFTFPVGDAGFYAGIGITAPSNTNDHFTAQYFNTIYVNQIITQGSQLDHISKEEYWVLDRTNGNSNIRVTLSYNSSDRSGPVDDLTELRVARFDGNSWESSGNATANGNFAVGTVQTNNVVSTFSPFTLGSSSAPNPLPISLINFNAVPFATKVLVKWSTSNESNNDFFTVEKSLDGRNWLPLGIVDGAESSNTTLEYELNDLSPVEGLQYYRLKQTDLNGKSTVSGIVPIRYNADKATDVVIYPQPAKNILNVTIQNNENENATITVYNAMGQKLIEMNDLGGNSFQIDLSDLASGVYYMEINVDGLVSKTKVIKQ